MSAPRVAPFDSEAGFGKAVDTVILAANTEILVFDRDLSRIALESSTRAEALRQFLVGGRHRRLRIVLKESQRLQSASPRLQTLVRLFGHQIEIRATPAHLAQLSDCFILADDGCGAVRFHIDHPRGKLILGDPAELRPRLERFRQIWDESSPCSVGTPLGL